MSSEFPPVDVAAGDAARARQLQLTKPPGSLGRLEDLACWFAARLGNPVPAQPPCEVFVFAADHGVAARGVSAFPQSVTGQMVGNFARGGAAINVLASLEGCRIEVVDVGVASDEAPPAGVRNERVRAGTRDLASESAMTADELRAALAVGERCARAAVARDARLLIAGDMGIANSTAAACLICAMTGATPESVVGRGTGVDDAGLVRKSRRGSDRACPSCQGAGAVATACRAGWAGDRGDCGFLPRGGPTGRAGVVGWLYLDGGSPCGGLDQTGCRELDARLASLGGSGAQRCAAVVEVGAPVGSGAAVG